MAKYRFEYLNNGIEIIDPIIEINPIVREVNPQTMTISVDIILVVDNAKFGILLDNVQVQNLNYDKTTLKDRVMGRLIDFQV